MDKILKCDQPRCFLTAAISFSVFTDQRDLIFNGFEVHSYPKEQWVSNIKCWISAVSKKFS